MSAFRSLLTWLRGEVMLCAAGLCALVSMAFVPPDAAYLGYINFKVLCLLFCLMAVVAGLRACGLFEGLKGLVLRRCRKASGLCVALVLLPFFLSMLLTNDVALIIFVPFALYVLRAVNRWDMAGWVVVLQTVAANLGSMATPIGNPQNLYLFTYYRLSPEEFFSAVLPLTLVSLVGLTLVAFLSGRGEIPLPEKTQPIPRKGGLTALCLCLLLLCLGSVFGFVDERLLTLVVVVSLLIFSRKTLGEVNYSLLLTFVFFFIFSGNMGRLPAVSQVLSRLTGEAPLLTAAAVSQGISNVPAAVLLSGFTAQWRPLLLGVNVGGLGTPIASLASVISFQYYFAQPDARRGKFTVLFLVVNLLALALLLPLAALLT